MRPKAARDVEVGRSARARLDQIINPKDELVQLGGKINWGWIDNEVAPLQRELPARHVALELETDAVPLFIYAGNDFMLPDQGCSILPRLVEESAGGSLLGLVAPSTN